MVDIPGNSSTTATIGVGGSVTGSLEVTGDHDWYRIELNAGQSISVALNGLGAGGVTDPYLRVYDQNGALLFENDDSGTGLNSLLGFSASYTGTYYIDAGAWEDNYTGGYQLSVNSYTPPPLFTNDQIANQLVNTYWGGPSGAHRFPVSSGGSISVNLTALTPDGRFLAREALALWSDIIGVRFNEVTSGGQITFDDNEEGAFADSADSGGITSSARVNVSTDWLAQYGVGHNTYSFQTYVHEIGHALGLGHAGEYNGSAHYPFEATFLNDSWATSIMSYFDQRENTHFANLGFTPTYVISPMAADVLAMSMMYSLSTTTRSGDTTYGFNSNADRSIYHASIYNDVSYTIFDSGGVDTLDYSGFAASQRIDLNAETFSNIGGRTGVVTIARGTVIENAIGGSGNDVLVGNNANNVLTGNGGADTLTGGLGNDSFRGTISGLTGDTITDFGSGDRILITDATISSVTYSLSGSTLTFGGGSLTLRGGVSGTLVASPVAGGGVQLTLSGAAIAGDVRNDFNGDGRSDVVWRADSGAFSVWSGLSNGGFVANAQSNSTASTSSSVVGTGDFNGDGRADVLWRSSNGDVSEWLGQVDGRFVVNGLANASMATDWRLAGTGDFNGDGRDDVVWRQTNGTFMGWFGQANGSFVTNPLSNTSVATSWHVVMTGDFNGDGRDDVAWRNDSGAFSVWHGQANGGFAASALSNSSVARSWHVAGAGDFNGDGRDDVVWSNDNGAFSVWHGQASGGFAVSLNSNSMIAPSWHVADTGDFNGDGRDDVLWRNDNGAFSAWNGQADGGFVANPNSNTFIQPSWHIQNADVLLV